jgi:hypothetical protein
VGDCEVLVAKVPTTHGQRTFEHLPGSVQVAARLEQRRQVVDRSRGLEVAVGEQLALDRQRPAVGVPLPSSSWAPIASPEGSGR